MTTDAVVAPVKEALPKRVLRSVGEAFFFLESERAAKTLAKERDSLEAMHSGALREIDAAMLLWTGGLRAEAVGHHEKARIAVEQIGEKFESLKVGLGDLGALKLDPEGVGKDGEVTESLRQMFDNRWEKLAQKIHWVGRVAMRPSGRMLKRVLRILSVVLALWVLSSVVMPRLRRGKPVARASSVWSQLYKVDHVLDNDLATNWLLADATLGWVEVTVPSHIVSTVKVWNVQGMLYYNTLGARIELFDGTRMVHTQEFSMESYAHTATPYILNLPSPMVADRVRVHVMGYTLYGGGFAQITVE